MNKKDKLFNKQKWKCNTCWLNLEILWMELDHKFPKAKWGILTYDNCQLLCIFCNRTKSNIQNEIFIELISYLKYDFISRNDIRFIKKHILSSIWDNDTSDTFYFNDNKAKLDIAIKKWCKDVYLIFNSNKNDMIYNRYWNGIYQ